MKTTFKPSIILFYFAYFLILVQAMFNTVVILHPFYSLIDKIIIILIIFAFFFQNQYYKIKTFFLLVFITIITTISYIMSDDNIVLKAVLLIIISKDIKFKQFIRFDLLMKVTFTILIIILSKFGISENYIILRADGTLRQSLGFSHPNALAAYWLSICCNFIYLSNNKYLLLKTIGCVITTLFVEYLTDSRTVIICVYLMLSLVICNNYFNINFFRKFISKLIILSPIILFSFSLLCAYLYSYSLIIRNIDRLLSKRIYYTDLFMQKYNITLFGQEIETVSSVQSRLFNISPQILDNSYILLLLKFGLLLLICVCLLLCTRLILAYQQKDVLLIIILLIFIISGFFESWLIKINYNPFLLSLSPLIFSTYNRKCIKLR